MTAGITMRISFWQRGHRSERSERQLARVIRSQHTRRSPKGLRKRGSWRWGGRSICRR